MDNTVMKPQADSQPESAERRGEQEQDQEEQAKAHRTGNKGKGNPGHER